MNIWMLQLTKRILTKGGDCKMKLDYKRTFFIGLAFFSISAFWQLYDNIIPLILDNTFHLGETLTGVVMAFDNALALFLLPLIGAFSDRVSTKIGKRMPFIIGGTAAAVLFMILLPIADRLENFVLFFIALGFVLVAMSFYRSPAVALMPDLTPKELRSKANAVINLMGAVGGVFTLLMISLLVDRTTRPDYTYVFLAVAFIMVLSVVILFSVIKENKVAAEVKLENEQEEARNVSSSYTESQEEESMPKEVKRSLYFILASIFLWFTAYNAVITTFSRYAVRIWGLRGGDFANTLMVATIAAVVSYIPIGFLSTRFGRKNMILLGIIVMSISYVSGFFYTVYHPSINLIFAFTGFGWASINVNSYPMVVELSRNRDIGKYTGLYYTFSMAAQIFTPIFSGLFLEMISYRSLFPYAVVFSVLSLCTMLFVKHGDVKSEKKDHLLEHFDIEDE